MKRFLPILAVCTLFLPAFQPARGADVSINFFYDNLSGGNWYEVSDYGYVWQPDVASGSSWRPYTDGYWAYTDLGWTWVSYEDFGWATYHYGRWARLADYGWVWVPGYEWGPAWVSWRTGGNYVGWAPLPPAGRGEVVYEGRPITGRVDVEFGIGPAYYNFIDVRYIGEPVLRDRIYDYNQNVTYINNTVNVTNITYNNSTVYNYGPDYATLSAYSTRPIQRLKIERQSIDPTQAVKTGSLTKVQGDKLVLGAPMKLQKAQGQQIAPQKVKSKIEQPKVDKGWANVSDPNVKTQLEQKFKTENSKNIPKPDIQPKAGANVAGSTNVASPTPSGSAEVTTGATASPFERGKGKHKGEKFQSQQPGASAAPGTSPAASLAPFEQGKGKKGQGREERGQAQPTPAATMTPAIGTGDQNALPEVQGAGGQGKHKGKGNKREERGSEGQGAGGPESGTPPDQTKRERRQERMNAQGGPNAPAPQQGEGRGKGRQFQNANQPPGGGENAGKRRDQQAEQAQPQGEEKGKGKKKGETSPTPPSQ